MSLNYTPSITSNNATVDTSYTITYTVPATSLILPKINSFSLTTSPATSTYTFNSKSVLTSAVSPSGNGLNYLTSNATTGNIYYGDASNQLIGQVTPAGVISTYTNTTGTNPNFLTFDNANINLYYSYVGGNSIYYVTGPSATPTLFTNVSIANPRSIAFDSSGNLYVVNTAGLFAISKFDSSGTILTTSTTSAATSGLRGCAFDNSNNLYVADLTNGRIWKCDASLNLQGFTSAGSIPNAASIVFDGSTYLYVSTVSSSKTVFRVDLNGNVTNFYPNGSFTNNASGLTYNRFNNNLYSLDYVAKTIYVDSINQYTFTGTSFSTPNTAYTLTITDASNNTITNSLTLNTLLTLNYSSSILTNNATVDTSYNITYTVPTTSLILPKINSFSLTTSPATSTYTFNSKSVLTSAVSPSGNGLNYLTSNATTGNIYYGDASNQLIGQVTPAGVISTYTNTTGTNPIFLAFDNSNVNLYYSYGGGNSIYKVTGPSATPTLFTNAGIANPRGIAFDSSGNLYVVNTAGVVAIRKFNSSGTIIANSTTSPATSGLRGCVCDNSNNLYVADITNGRIWKCDASLNLQGFTSAGSIPNAASIVFDGSTYLYVSTVSSSKTVFRVDLNGNVTNFYPNGSFTNNASGLTYNRFNNNLYSLDYVAKTIYVDSINQYTFTGTSFSTPNTAYTLTITDASSAIITNSLTLNTGSGPSSAQQLFFPPLKGSSVANGSQVWRIGTKTNSLYNSVLTMDLVFKYIDNSVIFDLASPSGNYMTLFHMGTDTVTAGFTVVLKQIGSTVSVGLRSSTGSNWTDISGSFVSLNSIGNVANDAFMIMFQYNIGSNPQVVNFYVVQYNTTTTKTAPDFSFNTTYPNNTYNIGGQWGFGSAPQSNLSVTPYAGNTTDCLLSGAGENNYNACIAQNISVLYLRTWGTSPIIPVTSTNATTYAMFNTTASRSLYSLNKSNTPVTADVSGLDFQLSIPISSTNLADLSNSAVTPSRSVTLTTSTTSFPTLNTKDFAINTTVGLNSITANEIPCLLIGTQILTPNGYKLIEQFQVGDEVLTHDNRIIKITNIKLFTAHASENTSPRIIRKGTYGAIEDLYLSKGHSILIDNTFKWPFKLELEMNTSLSTIQYYCLMCEDYYKDTLIANGVIVETWSGYDPITEVDDTKYRIAPEYLNENEERILLI